MTNKEIGEKIRLMRESRGMTQKDLAIAINKSESAVSMYEAGRRRPKDPVAEALADVFNVPKWSIFYNESEMVPAFDNVRNALQEVSQQLTAPSRSPEWRVLSEGLGALEQKNKAAFQATYNYLTAMYPDIFTERTDDDDPES